MLGSSLISLTLLLSYWDFVSQLGGSLLALIYDGGLIKLLLMSVTPSFHVIPT